MNGLGLSAFAGDFHVVTHVYQSQNAAVQVLANDSRRVAIIAGQPVGSNYWFNPGRTVGSGVGLLVTQTNPPIIMRFRDFGTLLWYDWWAGGFTAGASFIVIEVLYTPQGRPESPIDEG